jgi:2-polyprenyl-3-methyl-5-hydroxy-6-metoxy-1,4-benzoquinol methylase
MNKTQFEIIKKCDLCAGKIFKDFLKTSDRNYGTGEFNYVQCKNCDLVFLSPRPTPGWVFKFYPPNYGSHRKLQKLTLFQKIIRLLIRKNSLLAKVLIKDPLFFMKKGRLLDVGAGNGSYLNILAEWGWEAYGVEPDKEAIKRLKKQRVKNIYPGDLFTANLPIKDFDLIRYSHVLEHVPSPKKELKKARSLLKKNGKIFIFVPNIDSFFFKVFRSYWFPLEAPRHFFQYSPATLTKLLKVSGFKNIKISYNQSPYTFIWSLSYLMGKKDVGRRMSFFIYPLTLILRLMNILKKSDVIEVVAIKN